ncbi:phosphomevalonate kinase [Ornithinibacillus scapharcae]|uniref:phosphomevalonate kinase n=1 Tax=Ornithinibacillus scapharcae TaxID=1147159 RepID=UPI000527FE79
MNLLNSKLTIQVPGKLMIAGEFAVLEPFHKLAAMAVNRFVYIDINPSENKNISLEKFQLRDLKWFFKKDRVTIISEDNRVNFVQEAMTIACVYLNENQIPIEDISIRVKSELDDKTTGKKFGLGSSAAVSVGIITAMLQWHLKKTPSSELVFKLASIAHVAAQGNGSGADVAASSYGGVLQYSSFQADWLREEYQRSSTLMALLHKDWKFFSAKKIELPNNLYLCIGWTGSPASTGNLVEKILDLKDHNIEKYQKFLSDSEEAVSNFLTGIHQGDLQLLLKGIRQNRAALVTVGKEAKTELETPMIKKLCDRAEELGGAAKQSGAGGGDCGIAFMPTEESAENLIRAWRTEGIIPLELKPYQYGAKAL